MESEGAIPKICQVTWKQMLHVAKVVTENGVWGWKRRNTNTSPFLQSHIFPLKPKLDVLFGSRSRRGQRKSKCISISC